MVEPAQVIAEQDEQLEGVHPPTLEQNSARVTSHDAKDPDILLSTDQALLAARQRMQEQYNKAAKESLEKKKAREEKMREDKIAELECMQSGKGNRLKDNSSASVSDTKKTNSSCAKTAAKRRMKPEYNPLVGDTGASSRRWKPTSRGASGGG
ncbi:uncharacterized protein LOC123519519 isoform X1 [Portunus trituberculatus]|uniref:uncharacterized protein LOC123519519 isoform X1 n=1 Tax=Portunus trituberculatus TaxID=210409 RepID=UPI001E1CC4D4|nr:uncharacterized protein LOC123519519 isoform X1 [Portunus trituberculatus]